MAVFRGLFSRKDAVRGTTPVEARKALAGMFSSAGVLTGGTVTGTAGWTYSVAAAPIASTRGASDGVVLFGIDGPTATPAVSPAPGTGSRIDIIYAKHNDVDNADADSEAFLAVASGAASGTPVAPTIPPGAVELARATVAAGATSTSHANVTISHANVTRAHLRGTEPRGEDTYSPAVSTGSRTETTRVSNQFIPAADYDRVVEFSGDISLTGITANAVWMGVVTNSTAFTNIIKRLRAPLTSGASVGGTIHVSGSYDLPAGQTANPSLWVEEVTAGSTLTVAGSDSSFDLRVRPAL